jgi:hypothetical protein
LLLLVGAIDLTDRGMTYVTLQAHTANHELDDRGAVRWLVRQQKGADVFLTTHDALPAVWWYAGPGNRLPIVEASLRPANCGSEEIGAWLHANGRSRVLAYLGFGHDIPPEFDDALLGRLGSLGTVVAYRAYSSLGHALVVDIGRPTANPLTLAALTGTPRRSSATSTAACIAVEPARRW